MTRNELARSIQRLALIHGDFLLRSGQRSSQYFDKYRFESDPQVLRAVAEQMAELIPSGTEYLAGLEMGGIPVATALSLHTGIPCIFVRKEPKAYGTCQFAEGVGSVEGKKLCLVEDVVTTGGQVILSAKDLRKSGAIVENVVCVIHRGGGVQPLKEYGLVLAPLFEMSELTDH